MTDPEWAVGDADAPVGDDDGVFDVTSGHVAAPVGSVLVIFDEYIHRVVFRIHTCDVERGLACATRVHGKLGPFVDSVAGLL